jgi:hypothetical protein
MSTNEQYTTTWTNPDATLGMTIDEFLGRGLGYAQWGKELEARGLTWNANLRNTFIDREFLYFTSEIERLLAEPNTAQGQARRATLSRASSSDLRVKYGSRGSLPRKKKGDGLGGSMGKMRSELPLQCPFGRPREFSWLNTACKDSLFSGQGQKVQG